MIRSRSDWTDTSPVGSSFEPRLVRGVAIHWQGVRVDPATPTADILRADRRYHISKGWRDIAYNLAVDLAGDLWIARGLERRSTANGSTESNRTHAALVALLGPGQQPSAAMLAGIRAGIALVRDTYPYARAIRTHNDIRPQPTECPGRELTAAVRDGRLEPDLDQEDPMDLNTRKGLVRLGLRAFFIRSPNDQSDLDWHAEQLEHLGPDRYMQFLAESEEGRARLAEDRQQHGLPA